MLVGALGDSLLKNIITGIEILSTGYRKRERKEILKAGYGFGPSIKDLWFKKHFWFYRIV